MKFDSLPNETLQLIVDLCHEADEAYEKRMRAWLQDATEEERRDLNPWRGRSCSAVSMATKRLRSLSAKYLFTTLRLSKIKAPIFQYYIAHSPLAKSITRLLFDISDSPSCLSAFAIFSHLAGFLPNISVFEGFNTSTLGHLCGWAGLVPVPFDLSGPVAPSDLDLVFRQNRNLLLALAPRLIDLDVAIGAAQLQMLLNNNLGGVRKLKVTSSWPRQRSSLQSSNTGFPALLARCLNLDTLTLSHDNTSDSDSEEDADDVMDTVHDLVLEVPYSFAHSLRSLTLDFPHSSFPTSMNELRFASLFPSLRYLNITVRTPLNPPQPKIVLSSLTNLEIRHIYRSDCFTTLLHTLELPSLSALRLVTHSCCRLFSPIPASAKTEVEAVAAALNLHRRTLVTLDLATHPHDIPLVVYRLFTLLGGSVAINYNSKPLHEQSRRLSSVHSSSQSIGGVNQVSSAPSKDRFSASAVAYEESTRILKWATDYVERTKGTDKTGARELYDILKPVEDLMDWLKD